jgi:uncharacterized protein (DUF697 family)
LPRLPLHPAAVYGVFKEIKTAEEDLHPLVVAGSPEHGPGLVRDLTAGGSPNAVRDLSGQAPTAYDLQGAGLLLYVVDEPAPNPEDEQALKLADRSDVEAIAVLVGAERQPLEVPYVRATNVLAVPPGRAIPVERVAELVAAVADESGYGLAARLPVLRQAVVEATVRHFSRQNGVLGVAIFIPGADFPVLTLNQLRMVFRIAAAHGAEIDRERLPELLAVVGAGLGFRTVAREALGFVPGLGWAIKGGVAYIGTKALGKAAQAYFDQGGADVLARAADAVRSRS